ncbi:MAG: hypothetical protein AAF747_00635 [Planctomycetota bacterium]
MGARLLGGIIGGAIGGGIGAAIWAALIYFAQIELGVLAWGIGGMVGAGVAIGSQGDSGLPYGAIGVVLAIVALGIGKLGGGALMANEFMQSDEFAEAMTVDEELVISYVADEVVEELEGNGLQLEWPSHVANDPMYVPAEASDYPAIVWTAADSRWQEMSESDRQLYRDEAQYELDQMRGVIAGVVTADVAASTISLWDVLWIGLAVCTAGGIAYRGGTGDLT